MLKIIKAIKTFVYGLLTGIITALMSYLYIKNQKLIKKIIKTNKGSKNENDIHLQPQNRRQDVEENGIRKQGRIRQSVGALGKGKSDMEGNLQCRQLKSSKSEDRNKKRNVLGNNRASQREIQSNTDNELLSNNELGQVKRNRQNIKHDTNKPEMGDK